MNFKIFINGKPFEVWKYEDTSSFLARYILHHKDENALLDYFSIRNPDFILKKGVKLKVSDIRDFLKELSPTDIANQIILTELRNTYPVLASYRNILGLWLHVKYPTENDLEKALNDLVNNRELRLRFQIGGAFMFRQRYREYAKYVKQERSTMKDDLGDWQLKIKALAESYPEPAPSQKFVIRRSVVSVSLSIEQKVDILQLFDNIDVSPKIPLIAFHSEERTLFKVFSDFDPPKEWIESELTLDVIHFWISTQTSGHPEYTQGVWNDLNQISFSFSTESGQNESDIINTLIEALGNRMGVIKITGRDETGIGGSFKVKMPGYNKAVLAYLISLVNDVSDFIFMDELLETSTNKSVFTFSYKWWTGKTTNTFLTRREKDWVQLTVSHARDRQDIQVMRFIFSRIAVIYKKWKKKIEKKYLSVLSLDKTIAKEILDQYIQKQSIEVQVQDKRKSRLAKLINQRPELFITGEYSTRCQRARQPTLLEGKEALEKYQEQHKKRLLNNQALEFPPGSNDYYMCSPNNQSYQYPGLQSNHMANKAEFPYVPCCFKQDRKKKNKYLTKIWNDKTALKEQYLEDLKGGDTAYIVGGKRRIAQDKMGQLPSDIAEIARIAGYETSKKSKKRSLLRLGVIRSSSSFLHCMERALNPTKYLKMDILSREEYINEIRDDISLFSDFAVGKQELYDFTDEEIRRYLQDKKRYLDPTLFISLVEKYYSANIFLYLQNSQFPDGTVLVPRFSQAYLTRQIDFNKNTVLILVGMVSLTEYQCELIVSVNPSKFNFKGENLVKIAWEFFHKVYKVYSLAPTDLPDKPVNLLKYEEPPTDIFLQSVSQVIDVDGKTRVLNYDDLSILTSPLPPLDKPVSLQLNLATLKTLRSFLKATKTEIIHQETRGTKVVGVWIDLAKYGIYTAYIPLEETKQLQKVPKAPPTVTNPIATAPTSQSYLSQVKRVQKIASYLKEYTLFEYSIRQTDGDDTKDMFTIDPYYEYNLDEALYLRRDNTMYLNGKLIVPSKKVQKQLEYYLQVQLLNNRSLVLNYRIHNILRSAFTQLDDFRKIQGQLVFLSLQQIMDWRVESHGRYLTQFVQPYLLPYSQIPYFYRHPNIRNNQLVLIQNVKEGSLSRALAVGKHWRKDQTNTGFFTPEEKSELKYFVYSRKSSGHHKPSEIPILVYSDNSFAALLFF